MRVLQRQHGRIGVVPTIESQSPRSKQVTVLTKLSRQYALGHQFIEDDITLKYDAENKIQYLSTQEQTIA
jgi:hypothetical protein